MSTPRLFAPQIGPNPGPDESIELSQRAANHVARVLRMRPGEAVVVFAGDVLLVAHGGELEVFSRRCPHLGCSIGSLQQSELVCQCHGSRFAIDGKRISGPALSDLQPLEWTVGADEEQINVVLPG